MEAWTGTTSVRYLKNYINNEIQQLEATAMNRRKIRQLMDAKKFLKMVDTPRFITCQNISELKERINAERKRLKSDCDIISGLLPGYQLNLFEEGVYVTLEELEQMQLQKKVLDEEIHWLHKCLGICHNKEYFR